MRKNGKPPLQWEACVVLDLSALESCRFDPGTLVAKNASFAKRQS
jgi:hypothetical protein